MGSSLIVGKLIFAPTSAYYGLELCLQRAKREAFVIDEKTAWGCDVILVSMFWYRDILFFENFLRKSGLKERKQKPIIIVGGMQATITPEIIAKMADYVFIGDGDDYLGGILDDIEAGKIPECKYLYTCNSKIKPLPAECKPLPFSYLVHGLKPIEKARKKKESIRQNYQKVSSIYRVEIARGCKFKCPFCVLSGCKPYREVETKELLKLLDTIPENKTVALFAPERLLHSGWQEIKAKIKERNFKDFGSDVRLENIDKLEKDSGIFGLEGISFKLRKSVNKPFTDDFILKKLEMFCTTGKRIKFGGILGVYFIADLPGETKEDWKEIYELFQKISSAEWSRNLTLKPVLNPLSPKPFTPFQDVPVHPFINYPAIWEKFLRGGTGNNRWGFRIKEYSVWSCWERVIDTIIHRGKENAYSLISKIPNKLLLHNPGSWDDSVRISRQAIEVLPKIGLSPEIIFGQDYLRSEVCI